MLKLTLLLRMTKAVEIVNKSELLNLEYLSSNSIPHKQGKHKQIFDTVRNTGRDWFFFHPVEFLWRSAGASIFFLHSNDINPWHTHTHTQAQRHYSCYSWHMLWVAFGDHSPRPRSLRLLLTWFHVDSGAITEHDNLCVIQPLFSPPQVTTHTDTQLFILQNNQD